MIRTLYYKTTKVIEERRNASKTGRSTCKCAKFLKFLLSKNPTPVQECTFDFMKNLFLLWNACVLDTMVSFKACATTKRFSVYYFYASAPVLIDQSFDFKTFHSPMRYFSSPKSIPHDDFPNVSEMKRRYRFWSNSRMLGDYSFLHHELKSEN